MERMKRVCVAGGRDFDKYAVVDWVLTSRYGHEPGSWIVVSGGARGADSLGERFAREYGLAIERYPADWKTHGNQAGPIRNAQMAEAADELVAFWNGFSRGTANMIEQMLTRGKPVHVFDYHGLPVHPPYAENCRRAMRERG